MLARNEKGEDMVRRVALVLAGVLLALAIGPAGAEPVKIRIGWTSVPVELAPVAFENKAVLKHLGQSYTIELLHFAGSGPLVTAFAAGEVEIGALSPPAFGNAIVSAGLKDLRVVADIIQDGVGDHYSTEFLVRKDGPVQKIEDLKGKVVAVNAFGGSADVSMRAMLLKHGLQDRRDYTAIEVQFPNMAAVLGDGKVDLASAVPPFSFAIVSRGIGRTLFTGKEAVGPSQAVFQVMRASTIAQNRAAVVDFFEDYLRALHWMLDTANRQEALAIISRFTKRPAEDFAWVFTERDYYRDPDGLPSLERLQANLKTDVELGFVKGDVDVKSYADLTPIMEAAKRLR
jgi:sulfonate transport system substrate-binding protein